MNDVVLNKKVSMERCIAQIERYYALPSEMPFEEDYLRQDAICMNLQRLCELAIDIANHAIKVKKLGLPQETRDAFVLLHKAGLIDDGLLRAMGAMVGFRNILVHRYTQLDHGVLVKVIECHMRDALVFANRMLDV